MSTRIGHAPVRPSVLWDARRQRYLVRPTHPNAAASSEPSLSFLIYFWLPSLSAAAAVSSELASSNIAQLDVMHFAVITLPKIGPQSCRKIDARQHTAQRNGPGAAVATTLLTRSTVLPLTQTRRRPVPFRCELVEVNFANCQLLSVNLLLILLLLSGCPIKKNLECSIFIHLPTNSMLGLQAYTGCTCYLIGQNKSPTGI